MKTRPLNQVESTHSQVKKDFKADDIELATYVPKYTVSNECMFQHSHKKPWHVMGY